MLILASASPRRHRLLTEWGVPHRVAPSRIPEPAPRRTAPIAYARRLALAKALAVAKGVRPLSSKRGLTPLEGKGAGSWVLGADTIVVVGRRIFGKPRGVVDAERMLRALSGTTHRVITAVALVHLARTKGARPPWHRVRHAVSRVTMRRLTPEELHRFARKHRDKAGGYAIQDSGDTVIETIEGSYTNVVGLPKEIVLPLLRRAGVTPVSSR